MNNEENLKIFHMLGSHTAAAVACMDLGWVGKNVQVGLDAMIRGSDTKLIVTQHENLEHPPHDPVNLVTFPKTLCI